MCDNVCDCVRVSLCVSVCSVCMHECVSVYLSVCACVSGCMFVHVSWGRSSVVRPSAEFKSADPGFAPLVGQGDEQVLFVCLSLNQLLCRLLCA